jgi:hypothetical protein
MSCSFVLSVSVITASLIYYLHQMTRLKWDWTAPLRLDR